MFPDKVKPLLANEVTLTANFVEVAKMDVQDMTETVFNILYTPGTDGDSIEYAVEFSTNGTEWHPEPDEAVVAGVGTVIPKTRTFLSLTANQQFVPVLSMPVADLQVRVLAKETAAAGFGTVTINARASRLK